MSSIGEILKKYSNLHPLDKGPLRRSASPERFAGAKARRELQRGESFSEARDKGDLNYSDIELIISNIIKKPRAFILAHPEYKLSKKYELKIKNHANRRMNNEPLAYILGQKEFYGFNFKVDKDTLIPRPETELVVEEALNLVAHNSQLTTPLKRFDRSKSGRTAYFIDVGTGSGCIIITLTKLLNNPPIPHYQRGFYKFLATDISTKALRIAYQNAKLHKINNQIKFFRGNLLEPIIKNSKFETLNSKFIITANLPYLTPAQIKKSPSIQHEPKIALDAGRDGLKYYRRLFKQIKTFAKLALNSQIFVICEIDPEQTLKIKQIIKKNFPAAKIKIKKDLKGLDRIVIAEI